MDVLNSIKDVSIPGIFILLMFREWVIYQKNKNGNNLTFKMDKICHTLEKGFEMMEHSLDKQYNKIDAMHLDFSEVKGALKNAECVNHRSN